MTRDTSLKGFVLVGMMLGLSACASTHGPSADANDPLEPMNRATFAFNKAVDRAILNPATAVYTTVVPEIPRKGISNVMRNLREPWTFVNDILQLKFKRAGQTLGRFVVNSTIGLAGLVKVSDEIGIPYHDEDFGQTLATWGVGDGPYIVLPILGPSNGRDTVGFVGYVFGDPVTIGIDRLDEKGANLARTGIDGLDARARLDPAIDALYKEDDPYVIARSIYFQTRRAEIFDGKAPAQDDDLFDDLEAEDEKADAEKKDEGGN